MDAVDKWIFACGTILLSIGVGVLVRLILERGKNR